MSPTTPREKPRERIESPQEQYDLLLQRGIAAQKEYDAVGKLWARTDDDDYVKEYELIGDLIVCRILRRVDLIRRIESLPTIEDVFPRVKQRSDEEIDADELLGRFGAGKVSAEDIRAAGERMARDSGELTNEEQEAYLVARADLARELGYQNVRIEEDGWFVIERNGVELSLAQDPFPQKTHNYMPDSRIIKVVVPVKRGDYSEGSEMIVESDSWPSCTDPAVQKEIDRALAIFG